MKKRKVMALALAAITSLSLAACGAKSTAEKTSSADNEKKEAVAASDTKTGNKPYVVYILMDQTKDFNSLMKAGFENWAKENADLVDMTLFDAEVDVTKQASQCETAISSGADVIILAPVDSDTCAPITKMCEEAGIPLISCQNEIRSGYDVWVGSDHTNSGIMEAEFIVDKLGGKGKVAILTGEAGNAATNARRDGAVSVLKKYPDIEIVAEATGNWLRNEGMAVMEDWLQSNFGDSLNAVISGNDEMAIGALLAAKDAGRKDIMFAGVDGVADALDYVAGDEFVYVSIKQDADNLTKTCMEQAVKLASGEKVEKNTYVDVPYIKITKENVAEYKK